MDESLNDSTPRIQEDIEGNTTTPKLAKQNTAQLVQDMLYKEDDQINVVLSKVYSHDWWPYFYVTLGLVWVLMMIWGFLDHDRNTKSVVFHIFEFIVNLVIVVDILCKMKLLGFKHYFEYLANIIEFIIGVFWVVLYLLYIMTRYSNSQILQNVEQPIIFIIWCVWQVFRVWYLVFKQHKARDTLDPRISFNEFNDEIDNQSFMGQPSAKISEMGSASRNNIRNGNSNNTPQKIMRKTQARVDPEVRMSLSYADG